MGLRQFLACVLGCGNSLYSGLVTGRLPLCTSDFGAASKFSVLLRLVARGACKTYKAPSAEPPHPSSGEEKPPIPHHPLVHEYYLSIVASS